MPVRTIGKSRPEEPDVPVYRHFLSGGPAERRLELPFTLGLAVSASVAAVLGSWLAGQALSLAVGAGLALSASMVCIPLAALVARWAGRRSGLSAGLLAVGGWAILMCGTSTVVMFVAASIVVSILVYGLAQLPSRRSVLSPTAAAMLFYGCTAPACALVGPMAIVPATAVCLGAVLGNQNSRALRFFTRPAGLAVLGVVIALGLFLSPGNSMPGATWPQWSAVAILAAGLACTCYSVRTGHAASPIGRLLTSWLLVAPLLALLRVLPAELAAAVALPAWAAVLGTAAVILSRRIRRRAFLTRRLGRQKQQP